MAEDYRQAHREGYWEEVAESFDDEDAPQACVMCGAEHSVCFRDGPDEDGVTPLCASCWSLWEGSR